MSFRILILGVGGHILGWATHQFGQILGWKIPRQFTVPRDKEKEWCKNTLNIWSKKLIFDEFDLNRFLFHVRSVSVFCWVFLLLTELNCLISGVTAELFSILFLPRKTVAFCSLNVEFMTEDRWGWWAYTKMLKNQLSRLCVNPAAAALKTHFVYRIH